MAQASKQLSQDAAPADSMAHASAAEPSSTLGRRIRRAVGSRPFVWAILLAILALFWVIGLARGLSVSNLLSLTVWGISLGGIFALGSVGLTLTYGVLKFPNFSHGALITIGAYIAFEVIRLVPNSLPLRPLSFGWEFLLGLAVCMPVTGLVAVICDRLVFRHLRNRGSSIVLFAMASLGLAFVLRSLLYLIWGPEFRFYYHGRANPALQLPMGVHVQADKFFVLGLALVLVTLLFLLLSRTKMGKAMRATADNPDLAMVRGIDTERIIAWTWMIGGGLAASGGVLFGLASQLRPEMGFVSILLPVFAAVILGGIGNAFGALVGALVIGIAWQLTAAATDPTYGPGVAFGIMILILVIRPQGLFGGEGV
ncbi:MAG TPA: branched-chain amino acid ABC transporter permease [Salinisphaeraceae bacterium]|nr:branched-chain amino acid ABC transporter permease [Salinisphaeraceae bacterium]